MIVSRDDYPVYEVKIDSLIKSNSQPEKQQSHLFEFILNAALDPIDSLQW